MRIAVVAVLLLRCVPSCGSSGPIEDCSGQEYSGPRTVMVVIDDPAWWTATVSVGGACANPGCARRPEMAKCDSWLFDASGPTGSQCDLTLTAPNGAQCRKTLKLLDATTDCQSMNGAFYLSKLEGDDCTAPDAQ